MRKDLKKFLKSEVGQALVMGALGITTSLLPFFRRRQETSPERDFARNLSFAYLMLRLTMGLNMLLHGWLRLPSLEDFAAQIVETYSAWMPAHILTTYAYLLTYAEFLIGLFLIVGLWTRASAITGAITMMTLLYGQALVGGWDLVTNILVHSLLFGVLIAFASWNRLALDTWQDFAGRRGERRF